MQFAAFGTLLLNLRNTEKLDKEAPKDSRRCEQSNDDKNQVIIVFGLNHDVQLFDRNLFFFSLSPKKATFGAKAVL